ncbi:MAG: NAD-dependent succinate-semialdehyde dehydrogenase [Acidobacteriota bacterium]|nr:NAD-dependent succinate-semialdehyde dehydrogenase [Acidobacteriota bacterium]
MSLQSINPATGDVLETLATWPAERVESALDTAAETARSWAATPLRDRCRIVSRAAGVLRDRREELARTMSLEMGKCINEARAEVDKCAWVCEHYAEHGPAYLEPEVVASDAGRSYVVFQPLGAVLAVMPWNFPLWQVFRFAAPALVAGNVGLLKHASNVPRCAVEIERVWQAAGAPDGAFTTLMIRASEVAPVIADPRVRAVTLTGSDPAGRQVAAAAGRALKKTVLELGGSDPFVVLEDADLDLAVEQGVTSRFLNAGQSCIAAKRFILVDSIAEAFLERFRSRVEQLRPGDPLDETTTLAPLARHDLRDEIHQQVLDSVAAGARVLCGGEPLPGPGAFYAATILDAVRPGMRAYEEELFGPVAVVLRATDEADALRLANDTPFGLGAAVFSGDTARAERFALQMEAGAAFVNGMVKSDPRLPFGGIKLSGYGRELGREGIREFVNIKTVWIR